MSFSLNFAGGKFDLYPLLFFIEAIITRLWLMHIFLSSQWKGQFALRKKKGFNIVTVAQIGAEWNTMAHVWLFQAHSLIFLCASDPFMSVCLSVKRQGERRSDMRVDSHKQRHGAVRYHLRVDATRSRAVKSIWPPSLGDYNTKREKSRKWI